MGSVEIQIPVELVSKGWCTANILRQARSNVSSVGRLLLSDKGHEGPSFEM